ncbi:hypothetical protein [Aurantimonas sp. VKM B-3413]|uniref:hypothetical protein n=1 Tax=Aurantimonas sp. VKM B-3413 TaxID=2779401 RepID=UPI001E51399D|nr:hypothetical protein [Aurantimonas sp. VKM B-3413]MCB8836036.1 hypothetical protein [Aurantimonas sp. VKM B-3413]
MSDRWAFESGIPVRIALGLPVGRAEARGVIGLAIYEPKAVVAVLRAPSAVSGASRADEMPGVRSGRAPRPVRQASRLPEEWLDFLTDPARAMTEDEDLCVPTLCDFPFASW